MRWLKMLSLCLWRAVNDMIDHDGVELAGYLAFLGLLAIFPFLVFFVALAGFLGESEVGVQLVDIMLANMPYDVALALEPRISEIISGPPQGLLTLAIVGAIWTSSSAVEGLRTVLNRAYRVSTPPAYWFRRLLSIVQFFLLTAIIMVGMFLLLFTPLVWQEIQGLAKLPDVTHLELSYVRFGIGSGLLLFVVVVLYYIIPNTKQRIIAILPGAVLTVAAWIAVAVGLTNYIEHFRQISTIYGSLGGIIVTLLFFYLVSMMFITGAEFNYHLEKAKGHKIEEREHVPEAEEMAPEES